MKHRLAVIVPYRDRALHWRVFAPQTKARLPHADIFLIEQTDDKPFNRGKLLNIGYDITKPAYDYFCFHDIDMIPMLADYSYPDSPTLLATHASQFGFKMPFPEYFGGVIMFNKEDYEKCDGHSNEFWGWGGEDNEMYDQVLKCGLKVVQRPGRFNCLSHRRIVQPSLYKKNLELLRSGRGNADGLSHLSYKRIKEEDVYYTTKITVEI